MVCITDFVECYKSVTFSPLLSKGIIMPELLFCYYGTLFCGVPCLRLVMAVIVMDNTFHFLCYQGLKLQLLEISPVGRQRPEDFFNFEPWLSWSGHDTRKMMSLFCLFLFCFVLFFRAFLLCEEECFEQIKLTVVFWNWNSSRLANPQEAKILRLLSPGSDSISEAEPNSN